MRGQWLLMLAMAHSGIAYGGDWEEWVAAIYWSKISIGGRWRVSNVAQTTKEIDWFYSWREGTLLL